jgi:hypothetical protein
LILEALMKLAKDRHRPIRSATPAVLPPKNISTAWMPKTFAANAESLPHQKEVLK